MAMRADLLLLARGLVPTRSVAQRLLARGAVEWLAPGGWTAVRKAGEPLAGDAELRITDDAELRHVSRGGLKLGGALERTRLDVAGRVCLDVGQGTGGFTDALLACGAARVVGVDVGHGQLHPRLRDDPHVTALEGLHVRELGGSAALAALAPAGGFGLVAADLSFISLAGAISHLAPWLGPGGDALLLAKPQFEVGRGHVGKGGIVRDAAQYARVEALFRDACASAGWQVRDWFASAVEGGDGNREFFVWARSPALPDAPDAAAKRTGMNTNTNTDTNTP
jgi:23S rRNA (cytidine1920-2'-O)/16S rRNA (cytidine1409-2'-O)-methyltransferase